MISIYKVPDNLPALVINGKVYSGFQSIEQIEKTFPQLKTIQKKEVKPKAVVAPAKKTDVVTQVKELFTGSSSDPEIKTEEPASSTLKQ
jgi:hypothetical protein